MVCRFVTAAAVFFAGLGAGSGQVRTGAAQLPLGDVELVAQVHRANQTEIAAGQLAADTAQRERVRRYGHLLMRDHAMINRKLRDLARDHGIDTIPQPRLETAADRQRAGRRQETLERLQTTSPARFDEAFAGAMIEAHQHAIEMLQGAIGTAATAELRDLLEDVLPILRQHLALARDLHVASTSTQQ